MRANSFAVLVTGTGGALHASHLPVRILEEKEKLVLDMHMAKNNPQWKEFFDDEVMVVFAGPHAYVSPRWYEETGARADLELRRGACLRRSRACF